MSKEPESKIAAAVFAVEKAFRNRDWSDSLPVAIKLRNLRIDLEMSQEEFSKIFAIDLTKI